MPDLPDVQLYEPEIKRPIHQVGVSGVEVPFRLKLRDGGYQEMVAAVSMRTNVNAKQKGISMSRFITTLINDYIDEQLNSYLISELLHDLREQQGMTESFVKFTFKLPIIRRSPKSDYSFPLYHNCSFEGQLNVENKFKFYQSVKVQYSSYCPCSEELCENLNRKGLKGFPHAQRSFAYLTTQTGWPHYVWLEDLIDIVTQSIATIPYPIIKRIDEQEIARIAAENPIFVEDAIRQIAKTLDSKKDIYDWIVKCVHEESIHTSEAVAIDWKGIPDGFNERDGLWAS